jgi:MSHA pilin protein MshD
MTNQPRRPGAAGCPWGFVIRYSFVIRASSFVNHGAGPSGAPPTVLVGVLAVAAMNTMGAAAGARIKQSQRTRALLLAEDLLAEIIQKPYEDPTSPGGAIGIDTGESAANRATFDDVDDYNGWSAATASAPDGTALPWAQGFGRKVQVTWVSLSDPSQVSATETGLKQVTVFVLRGTDVVVQLIALRSRAASSNY